MVKRNYYNLNNGDYLGYNPSRKEKYFYCIFADGSECVIVEAENGRRYHFGNIEYCRRIYKTGIAFCSEALTDKFIIALSA